MEVPSLHLNVIKVTYRYQNRLALKRTQAYPISWPLLSPIGYRFPAEDCITFANSLDLTLFLRNCHVQKSERRKGKYKPREKAKEQKYSNILYGIWCGTECKWMGLRDRQSGD